MKPIQFTEIVKDSHFEYHLPCGNGLLEESLFFKQFDLEEKTLLVWNQYLWEAGITYLGSCENALLYSIIVKTLNDTQHVDISTLGNHSELVEYLDPIQLKKIEWKHSFEYTIDDGNVCRQYGYQTPFEFLNEMNYFNKDLSNRRFNIARVKQENVQSFVKTYGSDVTSWTFFLNADWDKLTEILQNSSERPKIEEILTASNCIVDLQIGGDEGYLDYVLIQSNTPLTVEIRALEAALAKFGNAYENIIAELSPIDDEWKIEVFKMELEEMLKEAVSKSK